MWNLVGDQAPPHCQWGEPLKGLSPKGEWPIVVTCHPAGRFRFADTDVPYTHQEVCHQANNSCTTTSQLITDQVPTKDYKQDKPTHTHNETHLCIPVVTRVKGIKIQILSIWPQVWFIHSLTHSLTYSLIHLLTHPLSRHSLSSNHTPSIKVILFNIPLCYFDNAPRQKC